MKRCPFISFLLLLSYLGQALDEYILTAMGLFLLSFDLAPENSQIFCFSL